MTAPPWLEELQPAPGPPWHAMGTRALAAGTWLSPADDEGERQRTRKATLLATVPEVVSAQLTGDDVGAAVAEAASTVLSPGSGALAPSRGDRRVRGEGLEAAALAVPDDLCVLLPSDGRWVLVAGVVCFPSMWRLPDKLGLPLAEVHGPVPAYDRELAAKVDRFLDRLQPDRPVWRRNWLVHEDDELHLPAPPPPPPHPPRVPEGLWLRSERQTLRRLPATGAVLFTIRTQQVPLAVVAERPALAGALADAIEAWSDDLVAYRGARRWRAAAIAWLRGRLSA